MLDSRIMPQTSNKSILAFCCEHEITDLLKVLFETKGLPGRCLSRCGGCAGNIDESMDLVRACKPGVVIANLPVDQTAGCGRLVSLMRDDPATRHIPVIVIRPGRHIDDTPSLTGLPSNVIAVFDKPDFIVQLIDRIELSLEDQSPRPSATG
jgi:hypothetical protein